MTLKYEHLVGLEFDLATRNCYTVLRDFYRDNYEIVLTDYACPTDYLEREQDLYSRLAGEEGFSVIHDHPRDWRAGDVILMAIQSSKGNHVAVLLPGGQILHHLLGQRSCTTPYAGLFRNTTVGVYRHSAVTPPTEELVDIRGVLPPHVRRRLEELDQQRAAAEAVPGT